MEDDVVLSEFEKLARRLGIEIRYGAESPSGLCTIKGKKVLFLNKKCDNRTRIEVFVREFRELDLEGIFVVPIIRELLGYENDTADW